MNPGFVITAKGWEVLANVIAGNGVLEIVGVAFGDGAVEEGRNPAAFNDLVHPIADGTTSNVMVTVTKDEDTGIVKQSTVEFVAEYRSNLDAEAPVTGVSPIEVTDDFYIREFGVWAKDPITENPEMIYYANLGELPHPVTSYAKNAVDVRRYPVTIAISSELEVKLDYPAMAFVTHEEMKEYVQWFHDEICSPEMDERIRVHNVSPEAHPDLRNHVKSNDDRISEVEKLLAGNQAASFRYDLNSLTGITLSSGIYNSVASRIEV